MVHSQKGTVSVEVLRSMADCCGTENLGGATHALGGGGGGGGQTLASHSIVNCI